MQGEQVGAILELLANTLGFLAQSCAPQRDVLLARVADRVSCLNSAVSSLMAPMNAQLSPWDVRVCSGQPSVMDVPRRAEAKAKAAAAEVVLIARQLAGLVWPEARFPLPLMKQLETAYGEIVTQAATADTAVASSSDGQVDLTDLEGAAAYSGTYAEWEVLQVELLEGVSESGWGEGLWCFNPGCRNLTGPCELQLKTFACGGGCGVRYCSAKCQVQGWRLGHSTACKLVRDKQGELAERRGNLGAPPHRPL